MRNYKLRGSSLRAYMGLVVSVGWGKWFATVYVPKTMLRFFQASSRKQQ